jgi:hypothetical protein
VAAKYGEWLTEEGLLRIQGWARDGLTDKDISKNMRVGYATLREWKKRFPEIGEALRTGKDSADRVVENALYKSATGYKEKVRRPVKIKLVDYDPETGKKIRETETWQAVEEEIVIPANVTAQIFWLKNRKPAQWRDKTDQQQGFSNGVLESLMELRKGGDE